MDIAAPVSNAGPNGFINLNMVWNYFGPEVEPYQAQLEPLFTLVRLAAQKRLIHQGEVGDTFYIVLEGRLRVSAGKGNAERTLAFIKPGEGVGEIAFLTGAKRTASVDAIQDTTLLAISRQALAEITERDPEAARVLYTALRRRVHQGQLHQVALLTDIFQGLEDTVLHDLQQELELLTVLGGETLMRAGDRSDELFIVIGGRLRVVSQDPESDTTYVVDTARGQTVGEIGLITGERRTASVFALRDTLLARLSYASFHKLLQKYPEAMLSQFAAPIIARLRDERSGRAAKAGTAATIAIIPTSPEVPLAEFTMNFVEALGGLGSTIHLDSQRCAARFGTPDIAYLTEEDAQNEFFVYWLNEQEATHDYVIYEADPNLTTWSERCVRQADLVLLVGSAGASPQPEESEIRLLAQAGTELKRQCLVLLQEDTTPLPAQSSAWLAPRQVRGHYHLRMGNTADYARLSRLITGRGVGLVLSGGGARALAHIGVIRALEESGVPIDAVGAVSAGAIVAGLWAMGLDNAEIANRSRQAIDRIDYTLPLHALTSGGNWTRAMQKLFDDVRIEDLWRYFYCTSTDLSRGQLFVHDSGSLMHAVRATTAIPGILPPVFHDGDILVDGGLINNLPADLMRDHPDIGVVIAVNVGLAEGNRQANPFDYALSGWKSLVNRLAPWASNPPAPTIGEILMRSISISNSVAVKASRRVVDRYFEPPVQAFGLLDFDKIDQLVELGYTYTREKVTDGDFTIP